MSRANILVVEDERIIARDLQATLQRAGYEVPGLAASGEEALVMAERFKPDLVLMDIVLQGEMDGVTAAGQLRERHAIPVIYLSSYGDQAVLERAKATEPIGYVLKPYEEQDLLTTVQVALHQFKANRKRVESKLLASEARFRSIFETALWGIGLLNPAGELVETNPAWQALFGYGAEELKSKAFGELLEPSERCQEAQLFQQVLGGKLARYQATHQARHKDGRPLWVRSSVSLFAGGQPGGAERFVLRMVEDVTEEKRVQEQLLCIQRMESIGALAGGLAHNLNNLISPAVIGLEFLRASEPSGAHLKLIHSMESGLQRAGAILKQLLAFGRGGPGQMQLLQPATLLEEMAQFVGELFPRSVRIQTCKAEQLWPLLGDANQLHQALLNLCTNARDAMADGGTLTLGARNQRLATACLAGHSEAKAGPYVVLSVSDTGSGMSRQVMERMFEPFYSTKPLGQGTGLGLLSTLNIIKQHKGFIQLHSEPGKGTEFQLFLPAAKPQAN